MYKVQKIILLLLGFATLQAAAAKNIAVCVDDNFWYPFTFVKEDKATGLHIDIIEAAAKALDVKIDFKPMPWQDCLAAAKKGDVDAVATASYNDERAIYLLYPEGAAIDQKSPSRVTQVEYVVITPAVNELGEPNTYHFTGDVKTFLGLPVPVRSTTGYSIAKDLAKEGIEVEEASTKKNFKSLIKNNTGCIIDLAEVGRHFSAQPEYNGKIIIQKEPISSKSYFLAFSKTGKINKAQAEEFWREIARIRDDQQTFTEILKKY